MEPIQLDPHMMNAESWARTVPMLISLWGFAGTMIMFSFSLMLAHTVIPSLIDTRHLPARATSWRPIMYGSAVLFFALSVGIFVNFAFVQAPNLYSDVFNKVWY